MKQMMLVGLISSVLFSADVKNDTKKIEDVIRVFSLAGDKNNVDELGKCLDSNYRIIMNQLFGSKDVIIMPRSVYLEKIKNKEFGGDTRKVTVHSVIVNGNTASAKVTFKGKKATFISILGLVKNHEGEWRLISDTPTIHNS